MNLQNFIPPIIQSIYFRYLKKQVFKGSYKTFTEASKHCGSYNSKIIFDRVNKAAAQVRDGKAVYERDSVLFEHIEYDYFLLSSLLQVASQHNGKLSVLDFGGALGTSYFQNKKYLDRLHDVSWNIVEQQSFVEIGKSEFASSRLHFYHDIRSAISEQQPNVAIVAVTLQYLENPRELIDELSNSNIQYLVLTMLPVQSNNTNRPNFFSVQSVPKYIYDASYVVQIFNEKFMETELLSRFQIIESFTYQEKHCVNGKWVNYKGWFLQKK